MRFTQAEKYESFVLLKVLRLAPIEHYVSWVSTRAPFTVGMAGIKSWALTDLLPSPVLVTIVGIGYLTRYETRLLSWL